MKTDHKDLIGEHVTLEVGIPRRTLLGTVNDVYRNGDGRWLMRVRHFNGEPWPLEPSIYAVDILERTCGQPGCMRPAGHVPEHD
jgi:hypothetical protein